MSKVLITGAGGYIGSVSASLFLDNGFEVVAIDNFSTGYKTPLELLQKKYSENKVKFYEADLVGDLSPIFRQEQDISGIVHYASPCLVNESMEIPEKYFRGVSVILNLLDNMRKNNINSIIFSST